jgi:SpoVK/Ycf46/Vps4 family AAA+-type ATPase
MRDAVRRAERRVAQETRASDAPSSDRAAHALAEACRAVGHVAMDGLAQRLPTSVSRADLVVPDKLREELDFAISWVRHQRTVFGAWQLERRVPFGVGLAALFVGPPGTGKTLAAQVIAAELEMLAYRVDLSQLVSKFIGETEKNLSAVFDRARAAGAILFFDEADALFGKRGEVKDATDRYANMEIGYLLQRIEAHDGVTVLATNRLRDLDPAFVRRFQIIADFPLPGPAERQRIWRSLLRDVPLANDIDFDRVARDAEISGGEIKNAVLAASFFAAREGVPVAQTHLRRALIRELTKTGKVTDAERLRGK